MYKSLFLLLFVFVVSCKSDPKTINNDKTNDTDTTNIVGVDSTDTVDIISDYDLNGVDPKIRGEFKEILANIEKEHGIQWDFCTCVVKNDSINKAFQKPNLPDAEFDRLFGRSDVIEQKCQAFLAQNPDKTPDERARHEKKVRDCLKAAGIK